MIFIIVLKPMKDNDGKLFSVEARRSLWICGDIPLHDQTIIKLSDNSLVMWRNINCH